MLRAALAVLVLAGTARAECWDYTTTDEVVGVAEDGSFVLRTTSYTSAGGGRRTELELVDAQGVSRGTLFHCAGEECSPEGWSAKGEAQVPEGNPDPAKYVWPGLTPVVRAPGAPRVKLLGDLGEEQAILLGKETLAIAESPMQAEVQEYMKGKPELFTHPATPFRFVRLSFKDACSHSGHREKQLTQRLVLVSPDRPKALALTAEGKKLLDADKPAPAIAKLTEAVKLDPSHFRARALLAQALAQTDADWKTARAALDVPRPRLVRTACIGLEDSLPTSRWPELYEWWRQLGLRTGCK